MAQRDRPFAPHHHVSIMCHQLRMFNDGLIKPLMKPATHNCRALFVQFIYCSSVGVMTGAGFVE